MRRALTSNVTERSGRSEITNDIHGRMCPICTWMPIVRPGIRQSLSGIGRSLLEDSVAAVFRRIFRYHLDVSYRDASIQGRAPRYHVLDQRYVGCSKQWALSRHCIGVKVEGFGKVCKYGWQNRQPPY